MAETITIRGLDENVEAFRRLGSEGRKRAGRQTLGVFFLVTKAYVDKAWEKIKPRGGMFRGMWWAAMKPQYTRETDGATVPAWGGTAKIRGVGKVQGKRRPSGQQVAETSVMMKDTGNLKRVWLEPAKRTDDTLHLGPGGRAGLAPEFVGAQNTRRPFMFWTQQDQDTLRKLHLKYLKAEIERLFK